MGADVKKKSTVPPLPASTETDSTVQSSTELATDISKPGDDRSSYSLPDDGTPVTIKTRGHRANKSQTSLLIEYFEGGKSSTGSDQRKPSVRVRVTPSSKKARTGTDRDRIQITETKTRKASLTRRAGPSSSSSVAAHGEVEGLSAIGGDIDDTNSYASATEESNVSRNPIDIEIDRSGNVRRRRPASPLIPAAESKMSYQPATMSDVSAIPTDSFFDGSGPPTSFKTSDTKRSQSRSPSRMRDVLAGATAGLAAAAAASKLREKSQDRERERAVLPKTRDKDRKHKSGRSRSRTTSREEKHVDEIKSSRRRSESRGLPESALSGADSSVPSSYDQRSVRSGASKTSSINNPKLLETVEDAIRRLILPELNALKREQSKHKERRSSTNSSVTSLSRDEYGSERRRSAGTDKNTATPRDSLNLKERRDREARHDFDDTSSQSATHTDLTEDVHMSPVRGHGHLGTAALGASLGGAAALAARELLQSPSEDKRSRRRRRADMRTRGSYEKAADVAADVDEAPLPPMPLMSEINPSELTRTSILSADTDRPQSASDELTPVHEVARSQLSADSSPTPIRNSATLQSLGAHHANVSHGDLRALPRQGSVAPDDFESREGMRIPAAPVHDGDYDEDEEYDRARMDDYARPGVYDYYNTQDVPPPLKYVPYQPERRGLSPIPSVSGYTEGGSEAPNRESRLTQNGSPERSLQPEGSIRSRGSVPSNVMSREFGDDDRSVRSSNVDYRNTTYTEDSELEHVTPGRAVRAVGANPNLVHLTGIESNVASLVDGSVVDGSVLTVESAVGGRRSMSPRQSMVTLEDGRSRDRASQATSSLESHGDYTAEQEDSPVSASQASRSFAEYEPGDYGRKVPVRERHSPRASEAVITGAAVGAAAAALRAQQARAQKPLLEAEDEDEDENSDEEEDELSTMHRSEGVQRNPSFKERAMKVRGLVAESRHDEASEHEDAPKMGFSGVPLADGSLPDGNWRDDDLETNPSLANGNTLSSDRHEQDYHANEVYSRNSDIDVKHGSQDLGISDGAAMAAGAAALAGAAAMAASHGRQAGQDQVEEWHRNSEDRKRDTIVTNPFEGTSPIANLPGLQDMRRAAAYGNNGYDNAYTRSPLGRKVDEGYISQDPHKEPDGRVMSKGKGVDFAGQPGMGAMDDPFFTTNDRHTSALSHGLESPLYDATTGAGIDSIESKDIVALMQHLMVRDAQRSARDTEILVTIVRAAAEMRNSFDDIKKMLAETEDVIITEVKENTDRSILKAINGPRPYPGSAARSVLGSHGGTSTNDDDVPARKRNLFRRALKGLSGKGANDLGRIEEMLMQLLSEVDALKTQTTRQGGKGISDERQLFANVQPEVPCEQDHGYEPEGRAGTSTGSHASQSGHLSIQSRATSAKPSYDRKVSAHRISTVPEANEDEYDHGHVHGLGHGLGHGMQTAADDAVNYVRNDMVAAPVRDQRGSSVPLDTPPHATAPRQGSFSNENTPRTDDSKKRKSGGKTSWFPKISRWSETTTSSVAQAFRRSKKDDDGNSQSVPFHSDSTGNNSDKFQFSDAYNDKVHDHDGFTSDKLRTTFSESEPPPTMRGANEAPSTAVHAMHTMGPKYVSMTPEDPKYQAHRNSLNLQHPQPRSGQTERFKAALESQALGFDSPMSPRSAEWAGSATSLHRLSRNQNQTDVVQQAQGQYWTSSPGGGPALSTKEPLEHTASPSQSTMRDTPPRTSRVNKLQKKQSPLPHHGLEGGHGATTCYMGHSRESSSSKLENRNLSSALGVPARKPSGPRAMTPRSEESDSERRRKRDTFGTIASQDMDTF